MAWSSQERILDQLSPNAPAKEHLTRYAAVVREFAYAAEVQNGRRGMACSLAVKSVKPSAAIVITAAARLNCTTAEKQSSIDG